ncbi:hypothetical protein ACOMHN_062130 [Nucella lapillus]
MGMIAAVTPATSRPGDDQMISIDMSDEEMASDSSKKEIKDYQANENIIPDDLSEALNYFDNALNKNNTEPRCTKEVQDQSSAKIG